MQQITSGATSVSDKTSIVESSPASRRSGGAFSNPPQVRKIPVSARAVGSYVPRLTKTVMQKFGFSTAALLTDWSQIVGPDLARYTRPMKLKWPRTPADALDVEQAGRPGATLYLQVDGARALDVQYKARQIVDRINSYFGYRAVADMRIEQTPAPALEKAALPRQVLSAAPAKPRASVDLGAVADDRLRAALDRLQKGIARR
jgi:hypothetical protein